MIKNSSVKWKAMASNLMIHLQICLLVAAAAKAKSPLFAVPGCNDTCGGVRIPYPFGMGDPNCFLDPWFEIECKPTSPTNHSKPFLSKFNLEVVELNYDGQLSVKIRIPPLKRCSTVDTQIRRVKSIDLTGSPYSFSTFYNVFMMEGCPGNAVLFTQSSSLIRAGCGTVCHNNNNTAIPTNTCFGVHCCQTVVTFNYDNSMTDFAIPFYEIDFNLKSSGEVQNCLAATLIDSKHLNAHVGKLSSSDPSSFPPVFLYWSWLKNRDGPRNHRHAECGKRDNGFLLCYCRSGYDGNPYVPDGCQGPQGCEGCRGDCYNQLDSSRKVIPNKYYCENTPLIHLAAILETEIPLLVYEFISNGTLYEHTHDPEEDFAINWDMRLKIAADSAGAISYLHSSSSIPIYHRDIKSSNILLDEKYRAKVSDFGSSKTVAMDQTHMTTLVQGTMGYLDPEYFQSYQFTEKSDVYSFGVVILELLTSKKPIYRDESTTEQKNLVTEFLFLAQDFSRLSNILDPKIMGEAKEDELIAIAELAKRCVCWSGKLRPTMKEVAMTLEMIIKSPRQVSTWYQQQEAFPIQYARYDGFDMAGVSDAEFVWNTLPICLANPPCSDVHPLLHEAS